VRRAKVLEARRPAGGGAGRQEPALQAVPDLRRVPVLLQLPGVLLLPELLLVPGVQRVPGLLHELLQLLHVLRELRDVPGLQHLPGLLLVRVLHRDSRVGGGGGWR
jgi:hypothetical protein